MGGVEDGGFGTGLWVEWQVYGLGGWDSGGDVLAGFSDSQLRKKPVNSAGMSMAIVAKTIPCWERNRIGFNQSRNETLGSPTQIKAVKPRGYPKMFRKTQCLPFLTIFLRTSHCADPMINPIRDPAIAAAFSTLS